MALEHETRDRMRGAVSWVLLLLAFSPTLVWMVEGWLLPGSYFAHGPLLVAVGLVALRLRHARFVATPRRPSGLGTWALALCLVAHVASQALMVDSFSGWLLVPALFALAWAQEGTARLRVLAAPLGCFFFAVPLPLFVTGKLAFALKDLATTAAVGLGNLLGLGLRADGARIWVPGQSDPLWVGADCSGLRSLTALFALGYLFAVFLTPRRLWSRVLFVISALLLALVANFVRITILAWIAGRHGTDFASGTAHDLSGYFLYAGAILLLVVFDRLLPGKTAKRRVPAPEAAPNVDAPRLWPWLVGLGVPAVLLGFYRPANPPGDLGARLPRELASFAFVREHALTEHEYALLGTRDVAWRRYRVRDEQRIVDLTAVFHGRNWKSLHPPEICLEAAGLEIRGAERRFVTVGGTPVEMTLLRAGRGEHRYLIAYLFGGPGYETPSFPGFFWHSVPRALLRLPMAGYMLRVEVPYAGDAPGPGSERVLARFLRECLPELRRLVEEG